MPIQKLAEDFAVLAQIGAADVTEIAAAGYQTIICNRPDSEQGAVPHQQIADAAARAGVDFVYLPVVSGAITDQDVVDMAAALAAAKKPVLAYCRSGARSGQLWQAAISNTGQ